MSVANEEDTHTGMIAWFARNHVAANLLMLVIILTGVVSILTIRTQIMPDLEMDRISIDVPFPGASPGEVETGVVLRIEDAVRDIEGVKEMRSYSYRGLGRVRLNIDREYKVSEVMDEVKLAVDRITGLPESVEKPSIYRNQHSRGAVNIAIFGDIDEKAMKTLADKVRDEVVSLPSVTKAEVTGARNYEISIEIKEAQLQKYSLTLQQVANAVRRSSLDLPAGTIQSKGGDIMLRTEGQAYHRKDFEKIVLLSRTDGTRLTLGDIAEVHDGFTEQYFFSRFNGKQSIGITVYAVSDQNQIDISNQVVAYVDARKKTLPANVSMEHWADSTTYLNETMNMMFSNIIFGVILVLVVLGLFLRLQLAFWVMLGMPVAFLGAFALLPLIGGSINMISLFGFILVLGIVVDDAIVIGESVQSASEKEGHSIDSVIRGAKRVAMPATFGVLTTIATFVPLLTVPGTFGALPAAIGSVIILCLAFSILESKFILPAHLASMKPLPNESNSPLRKFQTFFASKLTHFVYQVYKPFLLKAIKRRYTTLAIFIAMLIVAIGFVAGPYIKIVIFPNVASSYLRASVELVEGASPEQSSRVLTELTNSLESLNKDKAQPFIKNYGAYTFGSNGVVMVELTDANKAHFNPETIATEWRQRVGDIVGTKKLEIVGSEKSHGEGQDVSFKLLSDDINALDKAASFLQKRLKGYAGAYDIQRSDEGQIPEINLRIKPSAEALGLSLSDLANQVRAAFYGVEAQRIQRGREEVKVMVRYPKQSRESLGNLETMYIRTADGEEVPFDSVAEIDSRVSPSTITRIWGQRSVDVSLNVDKDLTQPGLIVKDITNGSFKAELARQFPSVKIELSGASLEIEELETRLLYSGLLALFAIYALMAVPLRSYTQPLIIMGVIPFGMIGAMVGHLILGIGFGALSLMGIVALAGVVVNDSIIMVDFVNKSVADGEDVSDAAVKAGTERFRAILLTSLTTFFGLLPILTEKSFSVQLVAPMAVSLGFGILFATVITLILIPCLYIILDDMKKLLPSRFSHAVHD